MSPLKEAAIITIKRLPDDCSAEDIMREVNFAVRIFSSLRHSQHGRIASSSELLSNVNIWENEF